jgi:hypothetical protein
MNVDHILKTLNTHEVAYLLIGGMNFLLRHAPVLTYDVDLWIEDTPENLHRCERALGVLQAQWGATDKDWGPVADKPPGWLGRQPLFCLTSPYGSIDVFRMVKGLGSWAASRAEAQASETAGGVPFVGLSDEDMLKSQMALPETERNQRRIRMLRIALGQVDDERHKP